MPQELTLDSLPQPGEPLQYSVDESNQQILESDIADRRRHAVADRAVPPGRLGGEGGDAGP